MNSLIEAAARGVSSFNERDNGRVRVHWDDYFPEAQERCRGQARAAFGGGIDPHNKELLDALKVVICPHLPHVSKADCMTITPGRDASECVPANCYSAAIARAVLRELARLAQMDTISAQPSGPSNVRSEEGK